MHNTIDVAHMTAPANDPTRNLVKGERYVTVELPYQEATITAMAAVELADKLIKESGLPYTIINLRAKNTDKD